MPHAFIIRPFGTKQGIDFDRVERELIHPALAELDIAGRTTAEILRQGNIRSDMFERLLTADLVVADMSIHNANVFYELGIRHAFREKRTFLIRCSADVVPFDLRTDRYFVYDKDDPGARVADLAKALQATLASEDKDSPVFQLLTGLEEQDASKFVIVPRSFREEVELALANEDIGRLALLTDEVRGFAWETEALRSVGDAQFKLKAWEGARITWERVRGLDENDVRANTLLGTVYQRLGDLSRSDQALKRALEAGPWTAQEAEIHALLGSNEKVRWQAEWSEFEPDERPWRALRSAHLESARKAYRRGFQADQNHYYSGLNELALLTVRLELARRLPDEWGRSYPDDKTAERELEDLEQLQTGLVATVKHALGSARIRGEGGRWVEISEAHVSLLTSERDGWVANNYRSALRGATRQEMEAEIRQLAIYEQLALFETNVQAVREGLTADMQDARETKDPVGRVLLFTGHRVDAKDRKPPRFPQEAEQLARNMIREAVKHEIQGVEGRVLGIAGGASGGDILFHEVCAELDVETRLFLCSPRDAYVAASVEDGGPDWVRRFDKLRGELPSVVLGDSLELPDWIRRDDYSVWERNNYWMLNSAWEHGAANVALIALWNGEGGDGPGGTAHMVKSIKGRGGLAVILDASKLVQPPGEAGALEDALKVERGPRRVFISYAREDGRLVEKRLLPFLKKIGIDTWRDRDSLVPGQEWMAGLREGVDSSDYFLVVVSKNAANSAYVKDELHLAINSDKTILPVVVDKSDPAALHIRLGRIQRVDFETEAGREKLAGVLSEQG